IIYPEDYARSGTWSRWCLSVTRGARGLRNNQASLAEPAPPDSPCVQLAKPAGQKVGWRLLPIPQEEVRPHRDHRSSEDERGIGAEVPEVLALDQVAVRRQQEQASSSDGD